MKPKYTFFKSSREGEADVFHNGNALPNLPFNVAEELCTAANYHYTLINQIERLKEEIESKDKTIDKMVSGDNYAKITTSLQQSIKELRRELICIRDEADENNGEVFIDIKRLNQLKTLIAKTK